MNYQSYKIFIFSSLFILLTSLTASAIITENDKQLNKNIKAFIPIYSNVQRISWEFWGKKYEFFLSLTNDEKISPTPPSSLSKEFLGYKNAHTKLNVLCNKLDPMFNRLLSSKVIETLDIDNFSKTFIHVLDDIGPYKKVAITISMARDMHDIEVIESKANMKIFRTYKPARIFDIHFSIKDASSAT